MSSPSWRDQTASSRVPMDTRTHVGEPRSPPDTRLETTDDAKVLELAASLEVCSPLAFFSGGGGISGGEWRPSTDGGSGVGKLAKRGAWGAGDADWRRVTVGTGSAAAGAVHGFGMMPEEEVARMLMVGRPVAPAVACQLPASGEMWVSFI